MNFRKLDEAYVFLGIYLVLTVSVALVAYAVFAMGIIDTLIGTVLFADCLALGYRIGKPRQAPSDGFVVLGKKPRTRSSLTSFVKHLMKAAKRLILSARRVRYASKLQSIAHRAFPRLRMPVIRYVIGPSLITFMAIGGVEITLWGMRYPYFAAAIIAAAVVAGLGVGVRKLLAVYGSSDAAAPANTQEDVSEESSNSSDLKRLQANQDKALIRTFGFKTDMFASEGGLREDVLRDGIPIIESALRLLALDTHRAQEAYLAAATSAASLVDSEESLELMDLFSAFRAKRIAYEDAQRLAYQSRFRIVELSWEQRVPGVVPIAEAASDQLPH